MSSLHQYEVIEAIGTGSFGQVSKIRRKSDGKVLVWKELDYGKMNEKEKQLLVSEVNILRELRHGNIVRYYDRIIDRERTKIFIVMEWCQAGDLAHLIRRCRKSRTYIEEDQIWKIFSHVVVALHECHTHKGGAILHRDIKPGNIFLDAQQNVKLGDFGLARVLGSNSIFAHTYVGTPFYMSPEQIDEKAYNEKSDIWSLGCLIYELATLRPPFDASNQITLAVKIKTGKVSDLPSHYSAELNRLVKSMLLTDQRGRPSTEELLAHPQLSQRAKERKMREQYSALKRREEDLRRRELAVEEREKAVSDRERAVTERERAVQARRPSFEMSKAAAAASAAGVGGINQENMGANMGGLRRGSSRDILGSVAPFPTM